MTTAAEVIEVQFRAVGADGTASAFDKINASSVKAEQQMKRFDAANDNAFKRINEGSSKAARAIGVFSMAASQAAPAIGKLGQTAMRSAETITQFGMYLGGPWGIALGLAVAGVSALTAHLNENAAAAKKNALAMLEADEALAEFADTADDYLRKNPSTGLNATQADLLNNINQRAALAEATGETDAVFDTGDFGEKKPIGGTKKPGGRGGLSSSQLWASGDRGSHDPAFARMQRREENERRMAALDAERAASEARIAKADGMGGGIDEAKIQAAGDATRRKVDLQFDIEREHADRMKSIADDVNDHYDKLDREAMERAQLVRQTAANAFGAVASAGGNALNKLAAGQKTSVKEFIGSIGQALVAQGTADVARAGAMFFDPLRAGFAPGLLAAAGVEIAVGMGMGAAGASGGGGGAGGARAPHARRGESGGDYLDRTRAASPTSSRGSGSGGPVIINQNINAPTVISYTDEQARQMAALTREGARHGVRA